MFVNNVENIIKAMRILNWLLDQLPPKEKRVIKYRFGFRLGRTKTLEEVAKKFNVTRERIRQIETKGIERMRDELKKVAEPAEPVKQDKII